MFRGRNVLSCEDDRTIQVTMGTVCEVMLNIKHEAGTHMLGGWQRPQ